MLPAVVQVRAVNSIQTNCLALGTGWGTNALNTDVRLQFLVRRERRVRYKVVRFIDVENSTSAYWLTAAEVDLAPVVGIC